MEDVVDRADSKVSSTLDDAGRKIKKILAECVRELFPDDTFPTLTFNAQLGSQNITVDVKGIIVELSEDSGYLVLTLDGLYKFGVLGVKTTDFNLTVDTELEYFEYNKYAYQALEELIRAKNSAK